MPVIGVGVDVVEVARLSRAIARTPGFAARVFTDAERALDDPDRLAARFAAKEAARKALGAPDGVSWHDVEVVSAPDGRPVLLVTGALAAAAERAGVRTWHVSLSHDGGVAVAFVLAEG